jgi:diacylglycerol kinase (ATP)
VHVSRDVARAARVIAEGKTQRIDIGHIEFVNSDGDTEQRVFANVASFGMSGLVVKYANDSSKRLGGKLTFLLATARATLRYVNQRVRLVFDGDPATAVETTVSTVAIANGRYFGGGMKIAPDAEVDDGLFDVVCLGDLSLTDFLVHSRRIYAGTHLGLDKVSFRRATAVRAEALGSEIIQLDVDGEQPGQLPASYRVLPSALSLIVP